MERGEHVELWTWRLAAGGEYRAEGHASGTREMLHVLAGSLRLTAGDAVHELSAGDSVLFSADRAHAYGNPGAEDLVLCMVVMTPPAGA
jgi:quercetin dioxygenase-like cupin family protein